MKQQQEDCPIITIDTTSKENVVTVTVETTSRKLLSLIAHLVNHETNPNIDGSAHMLFDPPEKHPDKCSITFYVKKESGLAELITAQKKESL